MKLISTATGFLRPITLRKIGILEDNTSDLNGMYQPAFTPSLNRIKFREIIGDLTENNDRILKNK